MLHGLRAGERARFDLLPFLKEEIPTRAATPPFRWVPAADRLLRGSLDRPTWRIPSSECCFQAEKLIAVPSIPGIHAGAFRTIRVNDNLGL
jgi:hypothetical protein